MRRINANRKKPAAAKSKSKNSLDNIPDSSESKDDAQRKKKVQKGRTEEKKREERRKLREQRKNTPLEVGGAARFVGGLAYFVKRVGIQYTEDFGTTLPGYMDSTRVSRF